MALAMRPGRPITRPMSPGPTDTSRVGPRRPSVVSTRTASGSSTSSRTMNSVTAMAVGTSLIGSGALELGPRARLLEQLLDPLGRLGALAQPVERLGVVDHDPRRILAGLVGAHDLDEPAVAWRTAVGSDDAVRRLLGLPHAHQAELHGHGRSLPSRFVCDRRSSNPPPAWSCCSSFNCFRFGSDGVTRPGLALLFFLPFLPLPGTRPRPFI